MFAAISRGVAAWIRNENVCLVVVHPCSGVVLDWSRWYHIPFNNNVNNKMNYPSLGYTPMRLGAINSTEAETSG